ncbi:MAG TPA: hypothetical protein VKQ36_07575, partial [Ktedonobacterales bacterium]|nr:hypothetical protein [Ktedonobacterales bacterium]
LPNPALASSQSSFPSTELPVTSRVAAPQPPDFPTARVPAPGGRNGAGQRGGMGFDADAVDAAFDATFGGAFAPLNDPGASAPRFAPRGPTFTTPTDKWRSASVGGFPDLPDVSRRRDDWDDSSAGGGADDERWQREWLDSDAPPREQSDWADDTGRQPRSAPGQHAGWDASVGWGGADSGDLGYDRYSESAGYEAANRSWDEAFTDEQSSAVRAHEFGHGPGDPPFSATELGLPRLTHPVLGDMPVSWQELALSDSAPLHQHRQDGYLDDDFSQEQAALAIPWQGASEPRASRGPNSVPRGGRQGPRSVPPVLALQNTPGTAEAFGGWENVAGRAGTRTAQAGRSGRSGRLNASATADEDDFARQPGWTDSDKALKRKRHRLAPIILVSVIVLTLLELLSLPVIRPDICNSSACVTLRSVAHRVIPSLGAPVATTHVVIHPSSAHMSVMAGASTSTNLEVSNMGATTARWQAASAIKWLTVSPAAGVLSAGTGVTLTLIARPVGVHAGSYTLGVIVQANGASISVPVYVTVMPGAALAYSPQTLTFTGAACGPPSAQILTIQNTGGVTLTVTISLSQAQYVLLNEASQPVSLTIAPNASKTISVAVSCQSSFPETYTLALTSNGGDASVTVQYGS